MKLTVMILLIAVSMLAMTGIAWAETPTGEGGVAQIEGGKATAQPAGGAGWKAFSLIGACLGAGIIVIGGGLSISRISSQALESIARQPEAAGQMFLSWLIPAAMIEGAMLFAVAICLLVLYS